MEPAFAQIQHLDYTTLADGEAVSGSDLPMECSTVETLVMSTSQCEVLSQMMPTAGPHGVCGLKLRAVVGVYNSWTGWDHKRQCAVEPFACVHGTPMEEEGSRRVLSVWFV